MKRTTKMEIKVPNGRIVSADVQDGICELVIEMPEERADVVIEVKEDEKSKKVYEVKKCEELFVRSEASKLSLQDKFMQYELQTVCGGKPKSLLDEVIRRGINDLASEVMEEILFVRIEASKLSLQDKFMQYEPQTNPEKNLKNMLNEVIERGVEDFYRPRIDPSFDYDGKICFKLGMQPAVGESYSWWVENAKKFNPKRKSRLGTKSEYVAFLGVLLKMLTDGGWSMEEAWHAVCMDSENLGHCWNFRDDEDDFETTGSREICGFCDLTNAYKILAEDIEDGGFWLAGYSSYSRELLPLAALCHYLGRNAKNEEGVGWLVLERSSREH